MQKTLKGRLRNGDLFCQQKGSTELGVKIHLAVVCRLHGRLKEPAKGSCNGNKEKGVHMEEASERRSRIVDDPKSKKI